MFAHRTKTEQLVHEMQAVVKHAEDLVSATADNTTDAISEARSRAEKSLHTARKSMEKIERRVVSEVKDAARETDDYVHENPWLAMGAAASAGVLIGILLARR